MPYSTFPIGSLRLDLSNSYNTKKISQNYPPSFLMSANIVTTMDVIGFV